MTAEVIIFKLTELRTHLVVDSELGMDNDDDDAFNDTDCSV